MKKKNKIIVLGGGTAGWMTALILATSWKKYAVDITLIESDKISTIGVGEGSTPALRRFFEHINVPESEWMPECNATYKCGITFNNWSRKPGFENYFHPFPSELDSRYTPYFFNMCHKSIKDKTVGPHPNQFFLASYLAANDLAPLANENFPFLSTYGYHFDAGLLGRFLKKKAQKLGVTCITATIEHVEKNTDGYIETLVTKDGESFSADFFIDCSGFASVLMEKSLGVKHISYSKLLLNDSAVTFATSMNNRIPSQTYSSALSCGWAWKIPLTNRFGNGYVYSSAHSDAKAAEQELREHLQIGKDQEARHLKMRVGRLEKMWEKNCLAIGLSQGFVEPLEATALLVVQQSAAIFCQLFERGRFTSAYKDEYNLKINQLIDGIKDYIVAHYVTNTRKDSSYWLDNNCNISNVSDSLGSILECWKSGSSIQDELMKQKIENIYPAFSWYCLLSGMGQYNSEDIPTASTAISNINKFYQSCSLNYQDHRVKLNIPY
ncbi:tryptophan halogenase family protein [Bowmanella pacifica]|uniref:Tryptophan halogenase n=1 Tax=Bowmanella pacifica TaxID=502051 RepID=A0A917YZD1_9ALTE|nr:tryptophan halogenase family protein [Bowmanella pacifica]GGO69703.1 tryptophan halogenase [Bowmanella pacifica]